MSISLSSNFKYLAHYESKIHSYRQSFETVYEHQKAIQKLETCLRAEFDEQITTFNWERDPEKRALLDQIYDLDLVPSWTERQYAFTETDQVLSFMQKIKSALETKSQEVQESYQLYNSEKEELMQYYHALIDIISKLAQLVSFLSQRV